ncbi:MAG: phosphatidylserine decarboxylase [Methanobacteriota archaeon]
MLAKGSGPFIAAAVIATATFVALAYFWSNAIAMLFAGLAAGLPVFVLYFFRDPERIIGEGVVSPADGKVMAVEDDGKDWHVAIFMNVHDVHVNRAPLDCRVASMRRAGDGFRLAYEPGSSSNVRMEWGLDSAAGRVGVHQITGWFARRIVPYAVEGQALKKGERFGMIRFGSRVDVWLPKESFKPSVEAGQRVLAGASTIAEPAGGAA